MNRITKEYYNRLRPLILPRKIPSFVHGDITKVFSMIKYECRQLATRWTVLSAGRTLYFKGDSWFIHSHLNVNMHDIHTGKVVIFDGIPIPEVVSKEVTVFRSNLDYKFRQQAERRIEQIKAKTARFLQMEVYRSTPENKVYFIEDTEASQIKIGVSQNPDIRLQTLETARGTSLKLLGTIAGGYRKEKELHRLFNHLRVFGEWFQDCPELRQAIQAMRR